MKGGLISAILAFGGTSLGSQMNLLFTDELMLDHSAEQATGPAPIPACLADYDGCDETHRINRQMNAYTPYYCSVYTLEDYTLFDYFCIRYQCLNGHFYAFDGYYQAGCNRGPQWGVPATCPNNSCSPVPLTGP